MFFEAHSSYSVTKNPYLKRLLGEGHNAAQVELAAPKETLPSPEATAQRPPDAPEAQPELEPEAAIPPNVQQMAKLWQSGDKLGVATSLMFTEASYKDLINLVQIIGHDAGMELGGILDELATESGQPPTTPPQYSDILKRVGGDQEDGVV